MTMVRGQVKKFIRDMYRSKGGAAGVTDTAGSASDRVYDHFTMATDTENINHVFNSVKKTIMRQALKSYNLA